jgi:hypothetical protein
VITIAEQTARFRPTLGAEERELAARRLYEAVEPLILSYFAAPRNRAGKRLS